MPRPTSYILCGTPRTGSTLLSSLLASTRVAGLPASYFREPDQLAWAERFGVSVSNDGGFGYAEFVAGAIRFGSTPNGVFAARVMWGTLPLIIAGLAPDPRGRSDVDVLQKALGPLRFVYLSRRDVVEQAVSGRAPSRAPTGNTETRSNRSLAWTSTRSTASLARSMNTTPHGKLGSLLKP